MLRLSNSLLATLSVILIISLSITAFAANVYPQDDMESSQVKAKFIMTFLNYIRDSKPSGIACVIDSTNITSSLKALNSKLNKLKEVKDIGANEAGLKQCSVIYFGNIDKEQVARVIKNLDGENIITISDTSDFVTSGGIIEMYQKDGHIAFSINGKKAKSVGLTLDSKLVELADKVI